MADDRNYRGGVAKQCDDTFASQNIIMYVAGLVSRTCGGPDPSQLFGRRQTRLTRTTITRDTNGPPHTNR